MSHEERSSAPFIADAIALARARMEELFRTFGARLPAEVQQDLSRGMEAILCEILSQHPAFRADADDFVSTAEAATLLFVSRPHVTKLLEQGKLTLHHETQDNRFLTRTSVLLYRSSLEAAKRAYQASTRDEE
ncbi:hypothetical protein AWB75_04145 [Caballeronia catudaia]|uniref:Helix-turn-helix domain protein n=1 Tax=Caballeronia catudaia TaxID=1777136 RepID=A0A158BWF1_9BURK|nr:hypothetical protein [Caballeronia catudaia]SAK74434.1 hypothetical protein AWB75_04145 [Caballeronia catudaia]